MVKHFYERIDGWFTYPRLYKEMVEHFDDGAHFVEVGSWMGRSAAFMAVEIANSIKDIRFDCVDTWAGSSEHINPKSPFYRPELTDPQWLFNQFKTNLKPVLPLVNPIRMTSLEASTLYPDGSLDFVFIDASHEYEDVLDDIKAWMPKVKPTGILAGHDYHQKDVKKAVDEIFGSVAEQEYCWVVR